MYHSCLTSTLAAAGAVTVARVAGYKIMAAIISTCMPQGDLASGLMCRQDAHMLVLLLCRCTSSLCVEQQPVRQHHVRASASRTVQDIGALWSVTGAIIIAYAVRILQLMLPTHRLQGIDCHPQPVPPAPSNCFDSQLDVRWPLHCHLVEAVRAAYRTSPIFKRNGLHASSCTTTTHSRRASYDTSCMLAACRTLFEVKCEVCKHVGYKAAHTSSSVG